MRKVLIVLDDDTERVLETARKAENRSWKNLIESIILRWIEEQKGVERKVDLEEVKPELPW